MGRAKPSHLPLFRDAYLGDTVRLSLEQHGLYLMLMLEAWDQPGCTLPDDEQALSDIAGITVIRFRKIALPVMAKWTRGGDGRLYQKRLLKEWNYVQSKREKAREAVAVREHRKCIERSSDDHRTMNTLGGGVGVGVGVSQSQEEELGGRSHTHAREGLTVIPGGAK